VLSEEAGAVDELGRQMAEDVIWVWKQDVVGVWLVESKSVKSVRVNVGEAEV
jgi:hypothetical protein